jgi:hypothetical protein
MGTTKKDVINLNKTAEISRGTRKKRLSKRG